MQINPLDLYLDKIFADLAARGYLDEVNIKGMVSVHAKKFSEVTGLNCTDKELDHIESRFQSFYEQSSSIRSYRNIRDVHNLYKRQSIYNANVVMSASQQINVLYLKLFGDFKDPANLTAANNMDQKALADVEISVSVTSSDNKGSAASSFPVLNTNLPKLRGVLLSSADYLQKEIVDKIKKTIANHVAPRVEELGIYISSPVDKLARSFQAAVGAEMMGYLEPNKDMRFVLSNFSSYMLIISDLFPYRENGKRAEENKKRLAEIIKKTVLSDEDLDFVMLTFNHQRRELGMVIDERLLGMLPKNDSTNHASSEAPELLAATAFCAIQDDLALAERLMKFDRFGEKDHIDKLPHPCFGLASGA